MQALHVLVALDDPSSVKDVLDGHNVDFIPDDELDARRIVGENFDLVVMEEDLDLIEGLKAADPRAEIAVLGNGSVDVVETLNRGASHLFRRPIDKDRFRAFLSDIEKSFTDRRETLDLEKKLITKYTFAGLVSRNPQMLEIFTFMRRVAPYYQTLLITGETGTGKEVTARALHSISPVANRPFLVCNCGAFVENLIQSELFGHTKGSFTGAIADKSGMFEAAGDGTLVLDEIGEMPLSFQPHLLRVLENGEFRKVGSTQASKARCRIIALTNRTLEEDVRSGRFREDLYYRLRRLSLRIPPLRERKDDLSLLYRQILEKFNERSGRRIYGISRPCQAILMNYDWPGNVRELANVFEEAAMVTDDRFIRQKDIPSYITARETIQPELLSLADAEREHIRRVMAACAGNKTHVAKRLGISRWALLRKIEKLGMTQ